MAATNPNVSAVVYVGRDGTILPYNKDGKLKNPTTANSYVSTDKRAFFDLLKSGDIRTKEITAPVAIELARPNDRTKRLFVRLHVRLSPAELQAIRRISVLDPNTALGVKIKMTSPALFQNIASREPMAILKVSSMLNEPTGFQNENKRIAHEVVVQPFLCSDYVNGGEPLMVGELKHEYQPDACLLNLLLESCAKSIPVPHRTVSELARLAGIPKKFQYRANMREMKKLSDRFKVKMTFVDARGELMAKYVPEGHTTKHHQSFRVIVDGNHAWLVNKQIMRFDQKYGSGLERQDPGYADVTDVKKFKWTKYESEQYDCIINTADDAIACAKTTGSDIAAVSNADLEAMASELYAKEVIVGKIRIRNGIITGMTLNANRQVKIKYVADLDDQPEFPHIDNLTQANLVGEYIDEAASELMPEAMVSTYNSTFETLLKDFPRAPICGMINPLSADFYTMFDQSKAYSTIMRNIEYIPAFSKTTEMYQCVSQETEKCCFYYVSVSKTDLFIAPTKKTLLYYDSVNYLRAKGTEVKLLSVYRPIKYVVSGMKDFVAKLYATTDLTEQNKKTIMNLAYGMAGQTEIKFSDGWLYNDYEEAATKSNYVFELREGLYCGYTQTRGVMIDGFRHVSRIVLEGHRISMDRLANPIGINKIVAIRTDAIYMRSEDTEATLELLANSGIEFGKLPPTRAEPSVTVEENMTPPDQKYDQNEGQMQYNKYEFATPPTNCVIDYVLNDEYDIAEVGAIVGKKNTIFAGEYAGVGKTTTCALYCKANDLNSMIVSPYGRLRTQLKKDGHNTYTLARFVGGSYGGKAFKPISVEGVDVVVFDEVYLCDEIQLESISRFIQRNPKVQILATGDLYQLPPVGCISSETIQAARDRFFNSNFSNRITLSRIKRVSDETERLAMMAASDYLKRHERFDAAFLGSFQRVRFSELTAESAKFAHITRTNAMRQKVNNRLERLVNKPISVGDVFLSVRCASYKNYKGEVCKTNLNSQDEYVVSSISDDCIKFLGQHIVQLSPSNYNDYMSRPYAVTCNSSQGLGLGDRIYIHEADDWTIDNVWLRTAITRCGTYSGIVLVSP